MPTLDEPPALDEPPLDEPPFDDLPPPGPDEGEDDDSPVTRGELIDVLKRVGEQIDGLAKGVAFLLEEHNNPDGEPATKPGRWRWRTLTGRARTELWNELAQWIEWFNTRYGSASVDKLAIPPCWPHHPVVVEELTALMVAWTAAYRGNKPSADLIVWHERYLWPCMDRIHAGGRPGGFERCSVKTHDLRHTFEVPAIDPDAFSELVNADVAAHTPHAEEQ